MISYYRGDERPIWPITDIQNGTSPNYTTGYTFSLTLKNATGTIALTKTTGIVGGASGAIDVSWAAGELNIEPGRYTAHLTITATTGTLDRTIEETVQILARNA